MFLRSKPDGHNRGYIVLPHSSPEACSMLQVKQFDRDEDYDVHLIQTYLPVPCFITVSQRRPVLCFQANLFPGKVVLVMSFLHFVLDGSEAGTILEALAECCRATDDGTGMTIAARSAEAEVRRRKDVSSWPSRCEAQLDHSLELGPPVFDSSITSEKWAAIETAMSLTVRTRRFTFSPKKVAQVMQKCHMSLSMLQPSLFISSNDIITAILGISVDRAQHLTRTSRSGNTSVTMTVDLRSCVQPPLPDTYVGNMAFPVWSDIYPSQKHHIPVKDAQEADLLHLT